MFKKLLAGVAGLVMLGATGSANAAFIPVGPQSDISVATVTGTWGWSVCWTGLFGSSSTSVASALAGCSGDYLMMASRVVGSATFDLLAAAPTADVIFNTGTSNTTHNANGTEWYFNDSWSWGFAPGGDSVSRNSCDTISGDQHMCWHTNAGNITSGYRSGNNFLNGNNGWERLLLVANFSVPEPASLGLFGLGLVGIGFAARRRTSR